MQDPREQYLSIYREIPTDVTFSLIIGHVSDGKGATPLRKVLDQLGEEFDVTDPATKQAQHVSLAHLRGEDLDQTTVSWRWTYKPRLPLSRDDAVKYMNYSRARGLNPGPDAERHLTGQTE